MCTIRVGKMSYGLNKTLQMCTVKTESGLSVPPAKVDLSPDWSTTSLPILSLS